MCDVIIIGAGAAGSALARELSRYRVNACVLEREEDVYCGTSRANGVIVHAGYDAPEGPLMAKLNAEGNEIMPAPSEELGSPFSRCGSFVVCVDEEQLPGLQALYERGTANEVRNLEAITDQARFREMEPDLTDEVMGVLYASTAGIVCPFGLNIVLAENAYTNGIDFRFNTEIQTIRKIEGGWAVDTNQDVYKTGYVVNTTGVHADHFHNMVSGTKVYIAPRQGDYCLLDKSVGNHVSHTTFALPGKYGEGVLISSTVHGNLIAGPTTIDIEDRKATVITRESLDEVISKTRMSVKDLPMRQVITSFTGPRAYGNHHEFIVEELKDVPGFVGCASIRSPGFTSCPATGRMMTDILRDKMGLEPNPDFVGTRQGILDPDTLTKEERVKLIRKDPVYDNVIYRCEMIMEGEILDAIHRPLGVRSLDGIKRRTRAGMGQCQTGFCTPRSMGLLHRKLGILMTEITETGGRPQLVMRFSKDRI